MLKVFDIYDRLKSSLIEIYSDKTDSSAVLHRVFEYLTGLPFTDVTVHPEKEVDTTFETIENVLARIKKSEPLEYIFNRAEFLDIELYTESSVLIPRPETEELALMISDYLKQREPGLKILDIGTGSGCIPIFLALQHPELTELEQEDFILSFFNVSRDEEALMFKKSVHMVDKVRNSVRRKMKKTDGDSAKMA